jgi:hypothetical protein
MRHRSDADGQLQLGPGSRYDVIEKKPSGNVFDSLPFDDERFAIEFQESRARIFPRELQ